MENETAAEPAERMRIMRARRRLRGLRELRLVVPDVRSEAVRSRIAAQVAQLNPGSEARHSSGSKTYPNSMAISRGDLVIVAALRDYGKPRPAVIVQSNAIPESHASVVICQIDFRISGGGFPHHD